MADLNEAFGEEGRQWEVKNQKHNDAISEEGMKKSLEETFGIDFATLVPHPKLRLTDDGSSHYVSKNLTPNKHYTFKRLTATWTVKTMSEQTYA